MIDQIKIDQFRAMEQAEGKAALQAYGKELGVSLKQSWSFDKMVAALEAAVKPSEPVVDEVVAPAVSDDAAEEPEFVEPVLPPIEPIELPMAPVDEVPDLGVFEPVISGTNIETLPAKESIGPELEHQIQAMSFDMVGDSYPWAWNMHNVQDRYWYGHINSGIDDTFVDKIVEYGAEWIHIHTEDKFTDYLAKVIKSSRMVVILRDLRTDNFYQIDATGFQFGRHIVL